MSEFSHITNNCLKRITWDSVSEGSLSKYFNKTDKHLSNTKIPVESLCCSNLNCTDSSHIDMIKRFYNEIIRSLNDSSLVSLHHDCLSSRPQRYKCKYGRISREFQWSTSKLDRRPTECRPRSEPGEPNSRF